MAQKRGTSHPHVVLCLALLLVVLLKPAVLEAQVDASPLSSKSPAQHYPRVSGLPSKEIEDRVNALLAAAEQQDLADRKECLAYRLPGIRPGFHEKIKVTYVSPHILSLDIRYSDFGCKEYQSIDALRPMTVDLTRGELLDWKTFFTDDFLQFEDHNSPLTQLYIRRAKPSGWCTGVLTGDDTEFDMWLDSRHGLMVQPSLSRRFAHCADLVSIPFRQLENAIRDPVVRRELLPPKQ